MQIADALVAEMKQQALDGVDDRKLIKWRGAEELLRRLKEQVQAAIPTRQDPPLSAADMPAGFGEDSEV